MTPARRAYLLEVARNATAHGRTLTGPHGEALLQAADAMLAEALEDVEGGGTPKPEAAPWRWVRVATGCYDLTTPSGNIRAVIEVEGDGYRPYIPGHGRCTYADDLPAALAILRARLGAGVPDLDLEACR